MLGADVRRLANPHVTNAHGAALLALVEAGTMTWDDADAALSVAEVHHPDPTVAGTYRRLLDAFVDAHDRWSPTFRILNDVRASTPTQGGTIIMSDHEARRPPWPTERHAAPVRRALPGQPDDARARRRPRARSSTSSPRCRSEEDAKADDGRVSGSIYSGDHEHYAFLTEAFGHFAHANVMQRDMYPSATKMESEIIAMTADMLHGDADTGGLNTSGGTESLVTAMLAYREWGRNEKGIDHPQIIMPVTGHPAMSKAFHWFDIEPVIAPVTDDFTVDLDFVRDHITDRTVALIGSAGTYPHGLIDPIPALGALALEHEHRPARRRLPRRVHPRLGEGLRLRPHPVRPRRARRDVDLRRHAQVRLRAEGQLGRAVPAEVAAPPGVLRRARLARRDVLVAVDGRQPLRRADRGDVGVDALARQGRLPAHRGRHLRHRRQVEGGGARRTRSWR